MKKKATIFCDIDGTIIVHKDFGSIGKIKPELTPNAEKINDWVDKGHHVILTTARPENLRKVTERELTDLGLRWSRLIMGIGRGPRILINDEEPNGFGPKAMAFSIKRNSGLSSVTPVCLDN